jgi:imidazolonepropionase-like amidohydrolase
MEVLATMEESARSSLRGGITTVRDLGCRGTLIFELRRRIESDSCAGPRIIASGEALTRTGGHGAGWIGFECDGVDGVRTGARRQLGAGADVLKVMATGGVMSLGTSPYLATYNEDEIRTVVQEGERENTAVAAHAEGREGIDLAIQAGVSTVEHGTFMDAELAARMIERGTAWVPTISPHRFAERARNEGRLELSEERIAARSTLDRGRTPASRSISATALSHFKRHCRTDGLCLGLGSDAGTTLVPHDDLVTEMEMFVEQGYGLADVLRMATLGNAGVLRLEHLLGSIEPGKAADLMLVESNPLEDLGTLRKPRCVLKDGRIVFSAI